MFETRSQAWEEVGLLREVDPGTIRRSRIRALVLLGLFICVIVLYDNRLSIAGQPQVRSHGQAQSSLQEFSPGLETALRVGAVIVLLVLGWWLAREGGRGLGPAIFRRMDPATAGTVGFLIRLITVVLVVVIVLRIAGVDPRTLAVGGAFTAVIVGLAAQQTLGNVFAGTVLLSARPFRVGDRVRLQGGPLAGQVEGIVSSLGLLYTTFANGNDSIMVPNSVVLNAAVLPLNEPDAVNLRARLRGGMTPAELQDLLEKSLRTELRRPPRITLEELDGDEAVVLISATPRVGSHGRQLASELLEVVATEARVGNGDEVEPPRQDPDVQADASSRTR
jgi:small-conductance mechanosensitive channel